MISVALIEEKTGRHEELLRRLNETGKCRVIATPSPEAVGELYRTGTVDVVIVLHDDPGQAPLTLIGVLQSQCPELPVILVSASYSPHVAQETLLHRAHYFVLPEPVASAIPALLILIDTAVDLERQRQQIIALNKKLELVGSITRHDVLNQLTAVNGYTELLSMLIEDPTMKSYLEKEQNALNKIRTQFQYAKEYQYLGIEPPRWQMIRSAVRRAGELFDLKTIRVVGNCGNAAVCADPIFERAIFYLFDNAIRFGGNVTEIHISLVEDSRGVVLVFADNGEGIPAAYKEKCFERGVGKNTGWGLFLVREILAMTKITITETGEPGKGTRFEMHIPPDRFRREREITPV